MLCGLNIDDDKERGSAPQERQTSRQGSVPQSNVFSTYLMDMIYKTANTTTLMIYVYS
jgi:hypothetical protein